MEEKELMKLFSLTLKMRKTILFLLIVVINGLIWIDLDIRLKSKYVCKGEVKGGVIKNAIFFSLN